MNFGVILKLDNNINIFNCNVWREFRTLIWRVGRFEASRPALPGSTCREGQNLLA